MQNRSTISWAALGVMLLLVSVGVAVWAKRGTESDSSPVNPSVGPAPVAVCFGRIDVPSGVASLYPLQPGRVEEVLAKEGQDVKTGEVLLVLDKQLAEQLVAQAREDLAAAKAQLDFAAKLRRQQELREAEQEAAIDVARARVKQADGALARKREFVGLGQANAKELSPLLAQVEEAQAAQRAEERKLDELRLLRASPGEKPLEMRRAEADVAAKEARLRQAEIGLSECQLLAPMRGTVLRVLVNKGDVLGPPATRPAIVLAPDEELIVRAEVEQEVVSKVRTGQPVVVEDDAIDGATWTGKVETTSRWFAPRRSILLEPGQLNDARTLEAIIRLDPAPAVDPAHPPLRIGQRVRVVVYDRDARPDHTH